MIREMQQIGLVWYCSYFQESEENSSSFLPRILQVIQFVHDILPTECRENDNAV